MAIVRLWPSADGVFNTWSPLGALARWEEVAQTTVTQPTAPLTTRGIKSLEKGNRQSQAYGHEAEAKLPAGAIIKKIVFWYYSKPSSAAFMIVLADTGTGGWETTGTAGATTLAWRSLEVPKASAEKSNAENFYANAVTSLFNNEKATEGKVHACYYEVEYETGGEVFSGTATIPVGVQMTATGSKMAAGAPTTAAGSMLIAKGAKSAVGSATLRTAASTTPTGTRVGTGQAVLRAGVTLVATTSELIFSGSGSLQASARVMAAGAKAASGQARLRVAPGQTAAGSKSVASQAFARAAIRIAAVGARSTSGSGALRTSVRIIEKLRAAKALGLAGRVNPFSRGGRTSPASRAGRTNPSQTRGRDA